MSSGEPYRRRVGILGGTFDPIHLGHLFIAEEARVQLSLEKIVFLPNGSPPHKAAFAAAADRHAMVLAALASNDRFECLDLELRGPGPSYTVETLRAMRADCPDDELFYITGADAVAEISTWRSPDEVVELAQFVAATRPGCDWLTLMERIPRRYHPRIHRLDCLALDISSTDIRERVATGRSARYLTPDSVLCYIERHGLYSRAAAHETTPAPVADPIRERNIID